MTITPHGQAVLHRAADWLEANPDKHITSELATAYDGAVVPPTDETADCFCALGRIAKEAGITIPVGHCYNQIREWFRDNVTDDDVFPETVVSHIWVRNDTETGRAGNPAVIPMLRNIANGKPY